MGRRQHPERAREAIDRLVAPPDADRGMQQQQRPAASALDELDAGARDVREVVGHVPAVKHGVRPAGLHQSCAKPQSVPQRR
jgi:hypothetical protein